MRNVLRTAIEWLVLLPLMVVIGLLVFVFFAIPVWLIVAAFATVSYLAEGDKPWRREFADAANDINFDWYPETWQWAE